MTENDIKILMQGLAPAVSDYIVKCVQPLVDEIVEQRAVIAAQSDRLALLERAAGYEVTGHKSKPTVRMLPKGDHDGV